MFDNFAPPSNVNQESQRSRSEVSFERLAEVFACILCFPLGELGVAQLLKKGKIATGSSLVIYQGAEMFGASF